MDIAVSNSSRDLKVTPGWVEKGCGSNQALSDISRNIFRSDVWIPTVESDESKYAAEVK